MKKVISFFALLVCLAVMLAGCVETPEGKQPETGLSDGSENPSITETAPATDEGTTAPQATDNNSPEDLELAFTEVTAVDNEECLIKITGIDEYSFFGYTLKVQLENKSASKTYMFSVQSAAINGVECVPLFAQEAAPGKKANDEIIFSDTVLEENGVGDYTHIELTFRVYDSDDWLAEDVALETIHIYPYGKDKAVKFVREAQSTDNVIVDNENVTVIVTGYEEDDIWGYSANVYMVNKTQKNVMFTADDVSVNGFMADPLFAKTVSPGNCAFGSISWSDATLEKNNITEIEEIELTLRAYDENDWFADDLAKETVTLNP